MQIPPTSLFMLKKPPLLGVDPKPQVSDHAAEASFLHLCSMARSELDEQRRDSLLNDALDLARYIRDQPTPEILLASAECQYQLGQYAKALECVKGGRERGWCLPDHCELRGRCLYKLGEFERAISAFEEAAEMGANTHENEMWIMRCRAHLTMENDEETAKERLIIIDAAPPTPTIRHDWYQSNTHVNLVVYVAGLTQDQVQAEFTERSVDVVIRDTRLHFALEKEIDPNDGRVSISKTKVEVRMKKAVPGPQGWHLDQ